VTVLASVSEERRGDLVVARIDGEIDASNVAWLQERLLAMIGNQAHGLAVDLSGTTYIDSAGLALLFELAESLQRHQQQLCLVVAASSPIARMSSLTGLDTAVPTYPTVEAAAAQQAGS
jgi:anti-anti-sigma factor